MNKYEQLIDKLAGETMVGCNCGCMSCHEHCMGMYKQIYIGDVLEKITDKTNRNGLRWVYLLDCWKDCGFTKSLQEIYDGTEVDEFDCECRHRGSGTTELCGRLQNHEKLADTNAEALFNLLFDLELV